MNMKERMLKPLKKTESAETKTGEHHGHRNLGRSEGTLGVAAAIVL